MSDNEPVLRGAKLGDYFITKCREIVHLTGQSMTNGEFRYVMRGGNGDRIYYNESGRTPLNYDPGRYIEKRLSFTPSPSSR